MKNKGLDPLDTSKSPKSEHWCSQNAYSPLSSLQIKIHCYIQETSIVEVIMQFSHNQPLKFSYKLSCNYICDQKDNN